MLKRNVIKTIALALIAGVPMVVASVPHSSDISNDTAIYQNLHEIKISRTKSLDFDSDIQRLSAQEKSHREPLPMRVSAPMDRIQKTPYKPTMSGIKKAPLHTRKRAQ